MHYIQRLHQRLAKAIFVLTKRLETPCPLELDLNIFFLRLTWEFVLFGLVASILLVYLGSKVDIGVSSF
jgi:hypothetical protein